MNNDNIKAHFAANPSPQELHFTADGLPFLTPEAANTHAQGLPDKKVQSITRSQAIADTRDAVQQATPPPVAKAESKAKDK